MFTAGRSIGSIVVSLAVLAFIAGYAGAQERYNLDRSGVALAGYDPVSYFLGSPVRGSAKYVVHMDGVVFRFANQAYRERFLAEPDRFRPAFGGWCGWAMLEGELVDVDPERYMIIDEHLVLFYNGFWGDTLEKWRRLAREKGDKVLFDQAQEQYRRRFSTGH